MNRKGIAAKLAALGLSAALVSACAVPIKSTVDQADNTDFSAFGTYAWVSEQPLISTEVDARLANPLNYQRVRTGIESELERKGYRKVDRTEADIVLGFSLGTRDRVRVSNYYDSFGYYYGFPGRFGRFGFDRGFGVTQNVRTITEGTLAVDVFDNHRREAIWHGVASKSLTGDPSGQQLIAEAVSALIGPLPDSMIAASNADDTSPPVGTVM